MILPNCFILSSFILLFFFLLLVFYFSITRLRTTYCSVDNTPKQTLAEKLLSPWSRKRKHPNSQNRPLAGRAKGSTRYALGAATEGRGAATTTPTIKKLAERSEQWSRSFSEASYQVCRRRQTCWVFVDGDPSGVEYIVARSILGLGLGSGLEMLSTFLVAPGAGHHYSIKGLDTTT